MSKAAENQGSTFRVFLPLLDDAEQEKVPLPQPTRRERAALLFLDEFSEQTSDPINACPG